MVLHVIIHIACNNTCNTIHVIIHANRADQAHLGHCTTLMYCTVSGKIVKFKLKTEHFYCYVLQVKINLRTLVCTLVISL
jgi:hypothetical protein